MAETHPSWMNEEALRTLSSGYLLTGETPRGMYERLASRAAHILESPELESQFFEIFWNGWFSPASPVASNFGTNRGLPISCYSVHLSDSVYSIYSHLKEVAALSKYGGGVGVYFGDVRPAGSPITGGGKSTGIVPWAQQYDLAAKVVSQGGVRRGSFAIYIPIDHPDLPELLRSKDHSQGDPRKFIDSNIAVTITDSWIEEMVSGDKHKQELFAEIMKIRMVSGSPYILFIDNVNNQNPECYKERGLNVSTSNLCFTGDTLVAVADGRNSVRIDELIGTKFPVYSARKSRNGTNKWVTEIKEAIAFKTGTREVVEVELEDGSTFRCTPDHELALRDTTWVQAKDSVGKVLEPFTHKVNSCGHVEINCETGTNKQGRMIWEYYNGSIPEGHHIDHIISQGGDSLENLQLLTAEEHFQKTAEERKGINNPIHKIDKEYHSEYTSASTIGKKNPRFSGIDNYQLIQLGKYVYQADGKFGRKEYLSLKELGYNIPTVFSNYRFGGDFQKYVSYVTGVETYNGEYDKEVEKPINTRTEKFNQIDESIKNIRCSGLKVVSVRPVGIEDVYDLTVEDNHNFFIVTNEAENVKTGVLVHNCSEITLYTDESHSFVCCLSSLNLARYDEWRRWRSTGGYSVPYLGTLFLDAVMEEFIRKGEKMNSMGRAVRFAKKSRPLGMGVMGLHTLYQKHGIPFKSEQARKLNIESHQFIREEAEKASKNLAVRLGEPEWCEGSGMRNSHLLAIAPTRTNSIICNAGSNGIEPIDNNYFVNKTAKGNFVRKNPQLEARLEELGQNIPDVWDSILEMKGSVQHLDFLSSEDKEVFKTAREIDQFELIKQAADRQPFICQAQSLNLFVDPEIPAEELIRLHLSAWKNGVKSLYYLKSSSLLTKKKKSDIMEEYKIITKENCPWCDKLKLELTSEGKKFEEINLSEAKEIGIWNPNWKTVPQLFINRNRVGGYTDYMGMKSPQNNDCVACEA